MNAQIIKLFGFVLALYALILGFTSYWSVFEAKGLKDNLANKRPLLEEQQIKRGEILASDGKTVIAHSTQRGSGANKIYVRDYPEGELYGNPIGYSFVNRGRVGFEQSHNDELVGNQTEFLSVFDELQGHRQAGDNVVSSLDPEAQRLATEALGSQKGSIVAIEPSTGKVRVMVSNPTYDPNQISDSAGFQRLENDPDSPILNRAVQARYPPGSTMKVVTAAAALDSGEFTPDSQVSGKTGVPISGVPLSNFGGESYGDVDLTFALTHSINTVWAQVAEKLGKDTVYKYMDRFGFDRKPQLDYPPTQLEISGVFGSGGQLLDQSDSVDIGRVAIGQERLQVTPLQMAEVAAAVANKGKLMEPRLWQQVIDTDQRTTDMQPEQAATVISEDSAAELTKMMTDVVNEGTGTAAALETDQVAGKTGTAEIDPSANINQPWFIGFAPAEDPKVAIAVTIERSSGEGGTVAAPIAQKILELLLGNSQSGTSGNG
ncbi:MAG: peptidoglycan D,D-transpeptidase FtsI family protein [Solirubrobacterales bacterium]